MTQPEIPRTAKRVLAQTAALALAAAAGWALHGPPPPPQPSPPVACAPAPALRLDPVVLVGEDGLVSMQLQRMPMDWVLERLAAQTHWPDVKAELCGAAGEPQPAAKPAPTVATDRLAAAAAPPRLCRPDLQADPSLVLQSLASADEQERFRGLMVARGQGLALPLPQLQTMYQHDPSGQVRQAAFDMFLERLDVPAPQRMAALQAALQLPHAEIRRDATQRLRELAAPPPVPPPGDNF
jgi:hypothetical protein